MPKKVEKALFKAEAKEYGLKGKALANMVYGTMANMEKRKKGVPIKKSPKKGR